MTEQMRVENLLLRSEARSGDALARKALGLKYLTGSGDIPQSFPAALQYLSVYFHEAAVAVQVAECVPLEFFMEWGVPDVLRNAAVRGSTIAAAKLGLWQYLDGVSDEAASWLSKGCSKAALATASSGEDVHAAACEVLEAKGLMDAAAVLEHASRGHDLSTRPNLLRLALRLPSPPLRIYRRVMQRLKAASENNVALEPLTSDEVTVSLAKLSQHGDAEASYFLGRAQLGLKCGSVEPHQIVPKVNFREGYAKLLRAAHQGVERAWYDLFVACSDYRSVLANKDAAQFFLEQGARGRVGPAMTALGARILLDAQTLHELLDGQTWLALAAEAAEGAAQHLLNTFPPAPGETVKSGGEVEVILERLIHLDAELAYVLALAREFRLTRKEALALELPSAVKSYSLVIQPERKGLQQFAVPATTSGAKRLLKKISDAHLEFSRFPSGEGFERRRGTALRALFNALNLDEDDYFQRPSADLAKHRSLAAWQKANQLLLKESAYPAHPVKG